MTSALNDIVSDGYGMAVYSGPLSKVAESIWGALSARRSHGFYSRASFLHSILG